MKHWKDMNKFEKIEAVRSVYNTTVAHYHRF